MPQAYNCSLWHKVYNGTVFFATFVVENNGMQVDGTIAETENEMAEWLTNWLITDMGVAEDTATYLKLFILLGALIIVCAIVWFLARLIMVKLISRVVSKTKTKWDDYMLQRKVFKKLAHIFPAVIFEASIPVVFADFEWLIPVAFAFTYIYMVVVVMMVVNAMLNAIIDILLDKPRLKDKPIQSYIQLAKIFNFFICGVLIISIALDKSPIYFFSALGAMTAVILLIFKDTILGFVASIQLAVNDMVRIGDWVTMPKYGADGDIMEINLTTVKVRNFDRTVTTIPTYAFISDSFKNWRGMEESDGRRIKRSINVTISSIRFCSPEMMGRFSKFQLIADYVKERKEEIEVYNKENDIDTTQLINGRNMTNIGVFRKYIEAYLRNNQHINKNMTCMVRQLTPTETGLPMEIYAFSSDKNWVNYEGIMADIFDHIFAAAPEFDLEIFQSPTGVDFNQLAR